MLSVRKSGILRKGRRTKSEFCSRTAMKANRLYHITTESEVETAKSTGAYVPAGFEREGFIHCSHEHQVAAVANRLFRGLDNLVLIEIDPLLVGCEIVEEDLEGGK